MPKTLGRSLLIFALMVLAVWSWQWLENSPATTSSSDNTLRMAETESDYYLQDFRIVTVNDTTGEVFQLSGQSLSHHSVNGNSSITQPVVTVYGANQTHWQGSAQHGDISADFHQVTLFGAVRLAQFPGVPADLDPALAHSVDKPSVEISSASLKIDTDTQTISTDDPVTIKSDFWSLNANQMRADINDSKLLFDEGMDAEYLLQP